MFEELLCKYLLDFYCGKTMPYRINKRDNTLTYTSRQYYWSFVVGMGLSLDSAWIWLGLIYFWLVQTRNSLMSQNSKLIGNMIFFWAYLLSRRKSKLRPKFSGLRHSWTSPDLLGLAWTPSDSLGLPRTPSDSLGLAFFQFNPSLISSIVSKPAFITQAYH